MVHHETGKGLFAYPRGRPGRDRQIGEKIPCPVSKSNTFNLMLSRLNAIKKIQFDYIQIQ